MDWTEEEENTLLCYLRIEKNNKRFLKRNAERDTAFKDCAVFLSRQSERRRHFKAKDVKNFCIYLVEKRYRLGHSNLSHLFRIGIFEKADGKPCDIFTREECRKFAQEDEAREDGLPIPEESTALPLRISESVDSVTRRGARYKSKSSDTDDAQSPSGHIRKRKKSVHPTSLGKCQPTSGPEEPKGNTNFPAESNHLVYKHRHLDGANIRQKFAELEKNIMIAADSLSLRTNCKISVNRTYRYGPDDFQLLKSIPIATMIRCWGSGAHFQIARALIGRAVFQWVFEDGIADSEIYGCPSKEAVEAVWGIKCEEYGMKMLKPFYAILKDAYFWQTTETKFLDILLPRRSRELSGHLATIIGHLFKTEVAQCFVEHSEQVQQKDCNSWPCQLEGIFVDALDLYVKLRQRDYKTIFWWPAINDKFDAAFMQNEGEGIANRQSDLVVTATYMPAVIDQHDSEDPWAVEGGVWYKAVIRLASASEIAQMPTSASALSQEDGHQVHSRLMHEKNDHHSAGPRACQARPKPWHCQGCTLESHG